MAAVNLTRRRLIQECVTQILAEYQYQMGRPCSPPVPLIEIAEIVFGLRCDVEDLRGPYRNASGALIAVDRRIILNKNQHPHRMAFTLAHELAHWLVDSQSSDARLSFVGDLRLLGRSSQHPRERTADFFAAALLMPLQLILQEIDSPSSFETLEISELAQKFGVSRQAMSIRLKGLKEDYADGVVQASSGPRPDGGLWNTPAQPLLSEGNRRPASLVVLGDFPAVDYHLHREFLQLRRDYKSLYLAVTRSQLDSADVLLELDWVDGVVYIGESESQAKEGELTRFFEGPIKTVRLHKDEWLERAEELAKLGVGADPRTQAKAQRVGQITVFMRSSDGTLAHNQHELMRLSGLVEPSVRLHGRPEATRYIRGQKRTGAKVVLVTGVFDLITNAHIRFLKRAKAAGDVLVVGLEDDNRVRMLNPFRPINAIWQRVEVIQELKGIVDFVFVVRGSPKESLKSFYTQLHCTLKPNILAVTEGDPYMDDRREEIEAAGGRLVVVSRREDGSSTSLLRRALAQLPDLPPVLYSPKHIIRGDSVDKQTCYQLPLPSNQVE